jgi:3-aminobutyryl-CoA ammonia-lyase
MSESMLRVRLGMQNDTHYAEALIPAATLLRLFADCSTEIGLRENNGREGLLAAYENAQFLKSCRVGDYLEIRAKVLSRGNRSRRVEIKAWRTMEAPSPEASDKLWKIVEPPELVAIAVLVAVTPKA